MNIVWIILAAILGLILLLLLIALFTKKTYAIERSVTINRPAEEVFHYIKHLKNQEQYSKWVMTDPAMKTELRGRDGAVGFVYAWDSKVKQAGAGEQEIMHMEEGKRLDIQVRFFRPFKGMANTPFTTEAIAPQQTKVTWGMDSKMKYPMNLFLLLGNVEKVLGDDIRTSLITLKGILEKDRDGQKEQVIS